MSVHAQGWAFPGTDRFEVRGRLGQGASGEVYRVFDRRYGHVVALKTLQRADAATVYRLKKEFRALADLTHPNLVRLYELQSEGRHWFFTMELVDGLDFLSWVRAMPAADEATRGDLPTMTMGEITRQRLREEMRCGRPAFAAAPPGDEGRLRDALAQLCRGLCAVHQAGKLHCDIKPTNIRVTAGGRVVLLDFGLVQHLAALPADRSVQLDLAGTPTYMSPEQVAGEPLTPASDWYAVGVLLYEALTGVPPHRDDPRGVLVAKRRVDPPPPRARAPGVPPDLDRLATRLLSRRPERRPHGGEILRRLTGRRISGQLAVEQSAVSQPFVGRRQELELLERALAESSRGEPRAVLIHGGSGMGKSRLLQRFVERAHHRALVLQGRCFERESVPFKALDAVIDALSRHLRQLPREQLEPLLPPDLRALLRLFPVLERVEQVAWTARQQPAAADRGEQRRKARAALRQLLANLAGSAPPAGADRGSGERGRGLVVAIDDLHWGDADSVELLAGVLRPPQAPPLLLAVTYRDEEAERNPALGRLLEGGLLEPSGVQRLALGPLPQEQAVELAVHLLGDRSPRTLPLARAIARESGGNPFFVDQLVRLAHDQALDGNTFDLRAEGSVEATFEGLIQARIAGLEADAARFLALVASAGRPLPLAVALAAAELGDETPEIIARLRAESLVRLSTSAGGRLVEPYHNRIGEVLYRSLDETVRRRCHRRLAAAFAGAGG
ncbi:MAG: AAA family ATPase, partial [Acidobacteria bacterium]